MDRYRTVIDEETGEHYLPVKLRGTAVLHDPILNKGTAFPPDEREALELKGLVPHAQSGMEQQLDRVYENYRRQPDDLARYLYLVALQDRNETLFYRLLIEHIEEMTPIVYTPTVGLACQQYSHIYRRPRGLYLTPEDLPRMREVLQNAPFSDASVIVATDGEGILGIGDQGAGGMGIPIGKLVLYTLGAGIHPSRCLPVMIDIGTDSPKLRSDPLYLGYRQPRLQGDAYFEVLDAFVEALNDVFPAVLLQWEDFSRQKAWSVLDRYRDRICSFNDDIQGTGAVTLAGILGVAKITGKPLTEHRFVVHGAGAGGGGIIYVLRAALRDAGLTRKQAMERIVALDSRGMILSDRRGLSPYKREFAADPERVSGWDLDEGGRIDLHDVVHNFHPTVLVGTSGQPGSFGRQVITELAEHVERPAVFALSNPTSKTEVLPADALQWTDGRAIVATGSPFGPVEYEGEVRRIGQGNNVFCFPGIGLGVIASGARQVTDRMLLAAARAAAEQVTARDLGEGCLYPSMRGLRWISQDVAQAVGEAALEDGVVPDEDTLTHEELADRIEASTWYPDYVPYRAF